MIIGLLKLYIFIRNSLMISNVKNNKLFCTFFEESNITSFVSDIKNQYSILYNKIFLFEIKDSNELACTYSVDYNNIQKIPINTILVHRKKETNTLYTINALNELIKSLNNNIIDTSYKIEWYDYKNTILLTQHNKLKQLKTKIYDIIEL